MRVQLPWHVQNCDLIWLQFFQVIAKCFCINHELQTFCGVDSWPSPFKQHATCLDGCFTCELNMHQSIHVQNELFYRFYWPNVSYIMLCTERCYSCVPVYHGLIWIVNKYNNTVTYVVLIKGNTLVAKLWGVSCGYFRGYNCIKMALHWITMHMVLYH